MGRRGLQEADGDDRLFSMKNGVNDSSKELECTKVSWEVDDDDSVIDPSVAMKNEENEMSAEKSMVEFERGATARARPSSPERNYAARVGAHAVHGAHSQSDDEESGTVVVGGGTVYADPVEEDGLEEEIRDEIQAEIRDELLIAQIPTAEAINPSDTTLKKKESSPICTRRRVLIATCIASLALVGVVVGLVMTRDPKEATDLNTIQGLSSDGEGFGDFIVLSRDGKTLAAGSDEDSFARVFRRNEKSTEWRQIGQTLFGDGQFVCAVVEYVSSFLWHL